MAALRAALAGDATRQVTATAVRFLLEELAERAPGNALEVRVPPFGAKPPDCRISMRRTETTIRFKRTER